MELPDWRMGTRPARTRAEGSLRFRCGTVERTLPASRQLEFIAPSPGGLLQILEGDTLLFDIGVNFFDETESNLRKQSTADAARFADVSGLTAESGPASDPLFWVLLAIDGRDCWQLVGARRRNRKSAAPAPPPLHR